METGEPAARLQPMRVQPEEEMVDFVGMAAPMEMTFDQEVAARFKEVMGQNPEADEGVIRRQVTQAVKEERRRREAAVVAEELRAKLGGMGVRTGKEVFES